MLNAWDVNPPAGDVDGDEDARDTRRATKQSVRSPTPSANASAPTISPSGAAAAFLVVMPQSPLDLVMQRFVMLDSDITTPRGTTLTVSWGAAAFPSADQIDDAIREADRAMYERKAGARVS